MHGLINPSLAPLDGPTDTMAFLGKLSSERNDLDLPFMTEIHDLLLPTMISNSASSPATDHINMFSGNVFPESLFDNTPVSSNHEDGAGSAVSSAAEDEPPSTSTSPVPDLKSNTQSKAPKIPGSGKAGKKSKTDKPSDENKPKRKQPSNKREPIADEFSDEEEFKRAWAKWRDDRDHNNQSVKRSRQRAKLRKLEAMKQAMAEQGNGGKKLEGLEELTVCRLDLQLLVRLIKGRPLSDIDQKRADALVQMYDTKDTTSSTKCTSTTRSRASKSSRSR